MKLKTISGHYGTVYSVAHNNREFVPKNVDENRISWNYNCIAAGQEAYLDINNPRNISEFWDRYRELNAMYWSDRTVANTLAYEKYQEHLEYMRKLSRSVYPIPHNAVEALITLLLLPLLIPCGIYLSKRQKEIKEEWEEFKQEQWIRDLTYRATKVSLRQTLYEHDYKAGARCLRSLDHVVKEMGERAGNYVPQVRQLISVTQTPLRYATLEEIYDKLYEPVFQEFQRKQRPCRRYNGTYLEQIREGQASEKRKKQQNKNSRSRKTAEAIEIVFGIGDMDNTGYEAAFADAKQSEELLKVFTDYLTMQPNICFVTTKELEDPNWQPPFTNGLIILNLTMHADEATPGVHMTCIPYSRNCKRGPKVQAALGRAMAGMGYPSTWKDVLDDNGERIPKKNKNGEIIHNKDGSIRYRQEPDKQGIIDWIEDQKHWLQKEMMRRYGWDREYKGSHPRGNLSTPDYQVARSRERLEALRQDFDRTLQDYEQQIIQETDKLAEAVDGMLGHTTEFDLFFRYLNECPEKEYDELIDRAARYFADLAAEKECRALSKLISLAEERREEATHNMTKEKRYL